MPSYTNYTQLQSYIKNLGSVLVAFSGGVDSTLVAKAAYDSLYDKALAVTAHSESLPVRELEAAKKIASFIGIKHMVIQTQELSDKRYRENSSNRCFFCKHELHIKLKVVAQKYNIPHILDGFNADDVHDFRPGRQASIVLGVKSPLLDLGFNKKDVRALAKKLHLPNWDKPSTPCLSSRFPYGTAIRVQRLRQIEQAEMFLQDKGLREFRVRFHLGIARIEVPPSDFAKILQFSQEIIVKFKEIGFHYVTLDLQGYRSGSLNEILP